MNLSVDDCFWWTFENDDDDNDDKYDFWTTKRSEDVPRNNENPNGRRGSDFFKVELQRRANKVTPSVCGCT